MLKLLFFHLALILLCKGDKFWDAKKHQKAAEKIEKKTALTVDSFSSSKSMPENKSAAKYLLWM